MATLYNINIHTYTPTATDVSLTYTTRLSMLFGIFGIFRKSNELFTSMN